MLAPVLEGQSVFISGRPADDTAGTRKTETVESTARGTAEEHIPSTSKVFQY